MGDSFTGLGDADLHTPLPPKFCKDCKWYRAPSIGARHARCAYPPSLKQSVDYLVEGEGVLMQFCNQMRRDDWALVTPCGSAGRFWEPKEKFDVSASAISE